MNFEEKFIANIVCSSNSLKMLVHVYLSNRAIFFPLGLFPIFRKLYHAHICTHPRCMNLLFYNAQRAESYKLHHKKSLIRR